MPPHNPDRRNLLRIARRWIVRPSKPTSDNVWNGIHFGPPSAMASILPGHENRQRIVDFGLSDLRRSIPVAATGSAAVAPGARLSAIQLSCPNPRLRIRVRDSAT